MSDTETKANSEGRFEFQSLPEGEYELIGALPGFVPTRKTVTLTTGEQPFGSLTLTLLLLGC